jgi:hypothetical protein
MMLSSRFVFVSWFCADVFAFLRPMISCCAYAQVQGADWAEVSRALPYMMFYEEAPKQKQLQSKRGLHKIK